MRSDSSNGQQTDSIRTPKDTKNPQTRCTLARNTRPTPCTHPRPTPRTTIARGAARMPPAPRRRPAPSGCGGRGLAGTAKDCKRPNNITNRETRASSSRASKPPRSSRGTRSKNRGTCGGRPIRRRLRHPRRHGEAEGRAEGGKRRALPMLHLHRPTRNRSSSSPSSRSKNTIRRR